MANTNYRSTGWIGVDLYKVYDAAEFPLGTVCIAKDLSLGQEGEFIFLAGVASCVEGSFVTYRPKDYAATLLAANAIGAAAIAVSAAVANKFGWFQIRGKAVGKVAALFADNGLVYATATPGVADDAAVAGDRVKNAIGASAIDTPATGFAYINLFPYPFMDDGSPA